MDFSKPFEITINNWWKYQTKTTAKKRAWFAVDSYKTLYGKTMRSFKPNDWWVFCNLLAMKSLQGDAIDTLTIKNIKELGRTCAFRNQLLLRSLRKLIELGSIEIRTLNDSDYLEKPVSGVESRVLPLHNITEHNITIQYSAEPGSATADLRSADTDNSLSEKKGKVSRVRKTVKHPSTNHAFDFESLYAKYPRKEGRTPGLKICAKKIKTQAQYDQLSLAIDRYAELVRRDNKEKGFIKHFHTFMNCWEDYLMDDTGSYQESSPRPKYLFGKDLEEAIARGEVTIGPMTDEEIEKERAAFNGAGEEYD